ncbi:hypothetical protein G7070_07045 [Propioniciclava coleopterorum]|uniref:Uncharacterized protein n=1 Tax=Propioniciclava coleopterorum TaxID=2714937 RepID=A0A6G7Y620_9ACTN|nr:hypothetical protein [Propioniciclava coleopterorum]QIK72067.1 hypothetical protein G7070_07045 [Propioniciclava coleopterorum]
MTRKVSDFGSLQDRIAAPQSLSESRAAHVDVELDGEWTPGLLAGWRRAADGAWWGRVAVVQGDDFIVLDLIATRVRPASSSGR